MRSILKGAVTTVALVSAFGGWKISPAIAVPSDPKQGELQQSAQLPMLAKLAVSDDEDKANSAVAKLRAAGPAGLKALLIGHANTLSQANANPRFREAMAWKRLQVALEKVGGQHDNWASRLYWFRDLEQAKASANKENKPILSLRLLGNLDEELSCANSRFFRTALYPDERIQNILSANFILHWESVRPVPKVTIDFGDGRKIETTITGNSVHYVLDNKGRVLDALPGLYGSEAFASWLVRSRDLARNIWLLDEAKRVAYLQNFHKSRRDQIAANWIEDLKSANMPTGSNILLQQVSLTHPGQVNLMPDTSATLPMELRKALENDAQMAEVPATRAILSPIFPTSRIAAPLAMSKSTVEVRLLQNITVALPRDRNVLKRTTTDELWSKIADLYIMGSRLDDNSLQVLKTKTTRAQEVSKTFEKSIAEDTVRNEYLRHTIIHQWLEENPNVALKEFNTRVYAEIFLTPDSDPWLGLLPQEVYTGISNDGVVKSQP